MEKKKPIKKKEEIKNLSEDMYSREHDNSSFQKLINEQNKLKEKIKK